MQQGRPSRGKQANKIIYENKVAPLDRRRTTVTAPGVNAAENHQDPFTAPWTRMKGGSQAEGRLSGEGAGFVCSVHSGGKNPATGTRGRLHAEGGWTVLDVGGKGSPRSGAGGGLEEEGLGKVASHKCRRWGWLLKDLKALPRQC